MNQRLQSIFNPLLSSRALVLGRSSPLIRSLLFVFGFSLLTGLSSHLKIPLPGTPVPLTPQLSVVMLAGLWGTPWEALLSQILFLGLGHLGWLPFSISAGLTGSTAGYLVGFATTALLISTFLRKTSWGRFIQGLQSSWIKALALSFVCFVSSWSCLGLGLIVLKNVLFLSWSEAWIAGVVPFLIGDLLKSLIAGFLVTARQF